jgi:hypothetical protein
LISHPIPRYAGTMLAPRIKLDKDLYARLKDLAEEKGYSSVDEYIHRILEREADSASAPPDKDLLRERLRGLGYVE